MYIYIYILLKQLRSSWNMLWTYVYIHPGWTFKRHTYADMVPYICLDFSYKGAPPGSVVDQCRSMKTWCCPWFCPNPKKNKRKAKPLLPEKLYRNHRTFKIKREFDEPPLSNPNNRVAAWPEKRGIGWPLRMLSLLVDVFCFATSWRQDMLNHKVGERSELAELEGWHPKTTLFLIN